MQTDPWVLILVSVITAGGLISVSLINLWAAKLANKNALLAAEAVRSVEKKLAETSTQTDQKLEEIKQKATDIGTAVDGRLSVAQNTITWLEQQLYKAMHEPAVPLAEAVVLADSDPRREPADTGV